ncbi:carbohydrate kinase family protein [Bacilliculturomica massiliensis]|uniref:carbohydrate kinase family protein n=1 Tax=Bacilliculturomica massiliensis TaxID=1917867 RepID=UPI00102FF398|nr:PfkB family carbohydrate kinase [Bacilliculturomica massiliensis]
MEYLVGGYTMLNDIVFADGSSITNQLGGSVFSAAGVKLWRDSVAYIGAAGEDFDRHYGPFFEANGIRTQVKKEFPHTLHYVMKYEPDGRWSETCKYGDEYEESAMSKSMLTPEMFAAFCGEDTRGIYLEASLSTEIVDHFSELKALMPNGKLMWEIATGDLTDPARREQVLSRIEQTDIYSMNFNESRSFFGVETEEEALEAILRLEKPCFFRAGTKGAYQIQDGTVSFLPSVGAEESVDATGCGNCSTAAALIGFAEGLSPLETLAMANVSAGYNARQYGPWPLVTEDVRREARAKMERLLASAGR